jgi:calcineurin-like phosphoesterase family protein
MFFFTADEHYGHTGIIQTCRRPFKSVEAMDKTLIANHNAVVRKGDTVIHGGDFSWYKTYEEVKERYISKLNGTHIFVRGNHDRWLGDDAHEIITEKIDGQLIIICHYAMRVWHGSHHNSWQLYGHSHGRLESVGKQCDIGVDAHYFYPVSITKVCEIMAQRPDNPDLIIK